MAMKFFKRSTDQLFIFPSTENLNHSRNSSSSSHHNKGDNTLTHVMHLFEEKNKYPPTVVTGPLPIKANGAIVVHRPSNRQSKIGTIRSMPIYLQDEPNDEDEDYEKIVAVSPPTTEETDISDMKMLSADESTSSLTCSSSSANEDEDSVDIVDLVHEENKRLRQQILLEREQNEKWRLERDHLKGELLFAKNTIRNLERVSQRFQKLLLPPTHTHQKNHGRRQSTGVSFDYYKAPTDPQHIIVSYERKLQILLDEIDAIEEQEKETVTEMTIQKNECEKLNRKLKYKDDIIRQLAYDLQLERK